jgi:hypothetical protein
MTKEMVVYDPTVSNSSVSGSSNTALKIAQINARLMHKKMDRDLINNIITNPILELVGGFALVDYLRHHGTDYSKTDSDTSFLFWHVKKTDVKGEAYLGDTAANWLELGIVLAVAAQQMKNNPAAERIAGQGVNALGQIGAAGVNDIGLLFKGIGAAARDGLLAVLGGL